MPVRMTARQATQLIEQRSYGVDKSGMGKAARTYNGRVYHSQAEMRLAQDLEMQKRAGKIQKWWPQVAIPLNVNGVKVTKMVCDFKVLNNDNTVTYWECKGFETAVFRLKFKLLKAVEPKIDYRLVKA